MAEPLDAEEAKLVLLVWAAMARTEAGNGAVVRDVDGRTYAAAPVTLSRFEPTSLQAAVAMPSVSKRVGGRGAGGQFRGRARYRHGS